jgi:hypothetical protein
VAKNKMVTKGTFLCSYLLLYKYIMAVFIAFVTYIYIHKVQHKDAQRSPSDIATPLLRTEVDKPDISRRGREFSKKGLKKKVFIAVNRKEDRSDSISVRKVQTHSLTNKHTNTHTYMIHIYICNRWKCLSLYHKQDCGMCLINRAIISLPIQSRTSKLCN